MGIEIMCSPIGNPNFESKRLKPKLDIVEKPEIECID